MEYIIGCIGRFQEQFTSVALESSQLDQLQHFQMLLEISWVNSMEYGTTQFQRIISKISLIWQHFSTRQTVQPMK